MIGCHGQLNCFQPHHLLPSKCLPSFPPCLSPTLAEHVVQAPYWLVLGSQSHEPLFLSARKVAKQPCTAGGARGEETQGPRQPAEAPGACGLIASPGRGGPRPQPQGGIDTACLGSPISPPPCPQAASGRQLSATGACGAPTAGAARGPEQRNEPHILPGAGTGDLLGALVLFLSPATGACFLPSLFGQFDLTLRHT